MRYNIFLKIVPVVQLDRILVSETKGRGFESRRAHHLVDNNKNIDTTQSLHSHGLPDTNRFLSSVMVN